MVNYLKYIKYLFIFAVCVTFQNNSRQKTIRLITEIRNIAFYTLLIFGVSCTESVPLIDGSVDEKILIVCELVAGEKATAHVVYLGDVNGKNPRAISETDTLQLWLREGNKDARFYFLYSTNGIMENQKGFSPSAGETYTLSGFAKYSLGESEPKITIPKPITLDTIKILDTKFTTNNVFVTHLDLQIYENYSKEDFYFLTMDQYNGQKWNFTIDTSRLDGQNPTKFIKEKNGLLINKSLLKDNTLPLVATINSSERPKNLKLKFCTTTEDFYRYNFYQESSNGVINQSSNPTFAHLNLNYKTVIGSFSGMSTKNYTVTFPQ